MDIQCAKCLKSIDITEANKCDPCNDLYCDECYYKYHERHNELEPSDPEWVLSDERRVK
jgi:hypothetical protein